MPRKKKLGTTVDEMQRLLGTVQEQLSAAQAAGTDPTRLGSLLKETRLCLGSLGRLRGEANRINERTITQSPAWRRIAARTIEVLQRHPQALRDLLAAWRELDGMDL